jgi:hypothetical protein
MHLYYGSKNFVMKHVQLYTVNTSMTVRLLVGESASAVMQIV